VLIHEYFGVNLKVIWDTYQRNLPPLKAFVQKVLEDEGQIGNMVQFLQPKGMLAAQGRVHSHHGSSV
jgi:hypothetical protein